ncbi:hypothetical protein PP1Y_AT22106 [Novosphingobium sp. PP1Y]|nr:hypothetical protein PP1Y_AT22106 [Novosphingobium sp. PP1Y]
MIEFAGVVYVVEEKTTHHRGFGATIADDNDGMVAEQRSHTFDDLAVHILDVDRQILVGQMLYRAVQVNELRIFRR